ncbi:Dolichyl-phosphate-mannose-protein mannosyltransferase [Phycisphaerae bacterium RAS1]|nr:Dolichyl-phosphate-mannose-protein mannosyltransferase [Phycisphaerae bacterium RAS1]
MGQVAVRSEPLPAATYPQVRLTPGLLLILTGLTALLLDLIFFTGYYISDDNEYLSGARLILETGRLPSEPMLGQKRLALVGWNLLVAAMFGYRVTLIAASYIVFHQGLIVGTYLLGRRMFDWQTGVLAAWYVATLPIIVAFSSTILPDIPIACFTVLALWCFQTAYDRADRGRGSGALWTFLAGLSVGAVYLIKEFGLILLPFFFFVWLCKEWKRRGWISIWRGAMFPLGFALIFAGEYVALSWLTGRPFWRLEWTNKPEELPEWLKIKLNERIHWLKRYEWMRTETHRFMYPIPARAVWLVCLPIFPFLKRSAYSILFLGLWIFLYLTWGSMSLTTYLPPSIQGRYYIPVTPFLILVAAAVIVTGLRGLTARLPTARRGILVSSVALLAIWPFVDLRGVDLFAGNNYNAPMYGNVMKAVQQAEAQRDRPVVLSGLLAGPLKEALHAGRPANLLLAQELTPLEIERMLVEGGCYFVDAYRYSVFGVELHRGRRSEACPLDADVHGAAWHNRAGRLQARSLGVVRSMTSRRAELGMELFHEFDQGWADYLVRRSRMSMSALRADVNQGGFDPLFFAAQLYEVKRAPRIDETLHWFARHGRIRDITPRADDDGLSVIGWEVVTRGGAYALSATPDGELEFDLTQSNSTLKLTPRADAPRIRVPAGHACTLVLSVRGGPSVWANVRLNVSDERDAIDDDQVETARLARNDQMIVELKPADSVRDVRPMIVLRGFGRICVEGCTLLIEPAQSDDEK